MRARIPLLFIAFMFLFTGSVFSQITGVLKGKVTSAIDNEPLGNAVVRLTGNGAKGTVSDIDGIYSLVLDTGWHTLCSAYAGLRSDTFTVHISANTITEHDIKLERSWTLLNTAVISSGKFDQRLEELTVS